MQFAQSISAKLNITTAQVEAVLTLLEEGSTIPFIARYRKDKTSNLDEVQVLQIQDEAKRLKEFTERKAFIENAITEQEKMTGELQDKIDKATTLAELEDIYLPYKPKRKTKAQAARENGLEPLALLFLEQKLFDINVKAAEFINDNVKSVEDVLQGARDIIAETINEDAELRAKVRRVFEQEASLQSKVMTGKETEGIKYKDYFDFSEPISKVPSHRILAILRGFLEGYLRIAISPNEETTIEAIEYNTLKVLALATST